ncbi:MAG: type II toxin-antitoxin system MqsA family antitoxin [Deltaproteobacteria bacterium]|nr:type II toxin-antitoxin system MqsA family antitoxin [Deltaproteobacteria bacterium]
MTGKREHSFKGKCAVCGGALGKGRADIPFATGQGLLLVKGVPAEICGDCGEPYLKGPVVDRVGEIVREFDRLDTEVSVVRYRAA